MKKEVAVLNMTGDSELGPRRGKTLEQMFNDFLAERPGNLKAIDEMWECLTPSEREASQDTIVVMRTRSYVAESKPVQAYHLLLSALKKDSTNVLLLNERKRCLTVCRSQLDHFFTYDSENPLIEIFYNILLSEASIDPIRQGRYLSYLVRMGKYAEASKLALPLVTLCPAILDLRDNIEEIVLRMPNEKLQKFLMTEPLRLTRSVIKTKLTPKRAHELAHIQTMLSSEINTNSSDPVINKILDEIIGELNELSPIDLAFKEFYYLKAVSWGNVGRNWDAMMLLQNLMAIDPCNLSVRLSFDIEARRFIEHVLEKSKKAELKIDIRRAFSVLKEITWVNHVLITQVSLAEVANGEAKVAKERMQQLCALNPVDGDYLVAALDVAMEAKDTEWMEQLLAELDKQKAARPWDDTVAMFETAGEVVEIKKA